MKKNLIAIVVLVVLGVAAFLLLREPAPVVIPAAERLVAVPAAELTRIRVVRVEGDGNQALPEEIVLEKRDGLWRLTKPVDYLANQPFIEAMVRDLSQLRFVDAIADNNKRHAELEVDGRLGIEVTAFAGEAKRLEMIVGLTKDNLTYVRLRDGDAVYRVGGISRNSFNRNAKQLRDRTVLDLPRESVTRLAFSNEAGELVIERSGEGDAATWRPVGVEIENFDARLAKSLAFSVAGLQAREYVDEVLPEERTGLGAAAAKVVVTTVTDGKSEETTVLLGRVDESGKDKRVYLKTSRSEQIFLLPEATVGRLRARADDFARTDEEVAKEAEAERKRAEQAAAGQLHEHRHGPPPGPMPAMGPGGQVSPEIMKQIEAAMKKQGLNPPPAPTPTR